MSKIPKDPTSIVFGRDAPAPLWALVEHYRSWLSFDGIERLRLEQNGGVLTAVSVRRIGQEYQINRGILRARGEPDPVDPVVENDRHAEAIAEQLNRLAGQWPDGLIDRARACMDAAEWACEARHTKGLQRSAMSKLMWFLKPEGWTLFDNFAATGLGVAKNRPNRMRDFYQKLDDTGFSELATGLNEILRASPFRALFGERVIDKYLMLRGANAEWSADVVEACQAFLLLLPCDTSAALIEVGRHMEAAYGQHALWRVPE